MPNKGKWTQAGHEKFLAEFEMYGYQWHMIFTIVNTQTSMQIKNHTQTYHASLSPESRACMLKNNAEAQQKCHQSLLPTSKARMLNINAKEQHKHRESLLPDTKPTLRRAIPQHIKNTKNLSRPIRKLAFRRLII